MTKTSNIKADFIQPVVILALICLVASALLAWVNGITADKIYENENAIAIAARKEVLPEADDFTKLDADLPDGSFVTEVYRANNGAGYVFMITCDGFGGKGTMNLTCGIGPDGKITATQTLAHEETPGMGSKTTEPEFRGQFVGKDASLDGVDIITGATFSSNYYLEGIASAFEAYEIVK